MSQCSDEIDFAEIQRLIQESKAGASSSIISGKKVIIVLGPTGAGKTTFVHRLAGNKLVQVDARFELETPEQGFIIGHRKKSETRFTALKFIEKKKATHYIIDCPGFFDTEGDGIDIANMVSISDIFKVAKKVVLVFLIPWDYLEHNRGSAFRELCTFVTSLMKDFSLLSSNFLVYFSRAPATAGVKDIRKEIGAILEECTENNSTEESQMMMKRMLKKKPRTPIAVFRPLADQDDDLLEDFEEYKGMPGNNFKFALPTKTKNILDNNLNFIENNISGWLEAGETKKIAEIFQVLRIVGEDIYDVKRFLSTNCKEVEKSVISQQCNVLKRFSDMLASKHVVEEDLDQFRKFIELVPNLGPILQYFTQKPLSLEELEDKVVFQLNKVRSLLETPIIRFLEMRQILSILDRVGEVLGPHFLKAKAPALLAKLTVKKKVTDLQTEFANMSITSDSAPRVGGLLLNLKKAAFEVAQFVDMDVDTEVNRCVNSIRTRLDSIQTKSSVIIEEVLESTSKSAAEFNISWETETSTKMTILVEHCATLRNYEIDSNLEDIIRSHPPRHTRMLESMAQRLVQFIIAKEEELQSLGERCSSQDLLSGVLKVVQEFRDLFPSVKQPTANAFRSLSASVRGRLDCARVRVQNELQSKTEVQYGVLIKDLLILKNSEWMAPFIPEISGLYQQAIHYIECSMKTLRRKIVRAWESRNYRDVEDFYDRLLEMEELEEIGEESLDPTPTINYLNERKAEFFTNLQSRLQATDEHGEVTVNLVDRDFKQIGETTSLFGKLKSCNEEEVIENLETYLGNYLNRQIKGIQNKPEDFEFHCSVLDLLTTVESLKFLPEKFRQKRDKALREVKSVICFRVTRPLEDALQSNQYAEAQAFITKLDDADLHLGIYLPSISSDLSRLKEIHRSGMKESTGNIATILKNDDYTQLNNILEVLPEGQHKSVKAVINSHLQKKKRTLQASIRRISPKSSDEEHASLMSEIRNLSEANITEGFVNEDFIPSKIAIELVKLLDNKCKQELKNGWTQLQLNHHLIDWELALSFWRLVQEELPTSLHLCLRESRNYLTEIKWLSGSSTTTEVKKKIQECLKVGDLSTLASVYEETLTPQLLNANSEFKSVQSEINAAMKNYFDTVVKPIEALHGTEKVELLSNIINQFSDLPETFTKLFQQQLNHCAKVIQQASEQRDSIIISFVQHLADNEWDQAAALYHKCKTDSTFKALLDSKLTKEMDSFNTKIRRALELPVDQTIETMQQIENFLEVFFKAQSSPFVPDERITALLKECLTGYLAKITSASTWTDIMAHSKFPLAIYRFSWTRNEEEEDLISKAFNEVIATRLSVATTSFKQGCAQLDIPKIVDYLQLAKQIDTFIVTLLGFVKDLSKTHDLEKELSIFVRFQEALETTLKEIELLPEKAKEYWRTKNILAIKQCWTARANVESLFMYVDKNRATTAFNTVIKFLEAKHKEMFENTEKYLAKQEWDKFNKTYHELNELNTIVELQAKSYTKGIFEQIERNIKQLEEHGRRSNSPQEVARDLCNLYEEQERFPFAKELIKKAEANILHRPNNPEFIKNVGTQLLVIGDRVANQVIAGNQNFSRINQELWIGKVKDQGIEYALENFKLNSKNLWEKLKGALFSSDYKDYYDTFELRFTTAVEENISKRYQGITEIVADLKSTGLARPNIGIILASVFAVWTLHKFLGGGGAVSDSESSTLFKPHPVQVLSLLRLLTGKKITELNTEKQLIEVLTGEGKSIILGVCATVYALLDYTVTCTSYSGYLSERDYNDFKDIFGYFGVNKKIEYCPVDGLCESMMNQRGNIRDLTTSVLEGKALAHSSISANKEKTVLLIDEVDVLFSPAFYGETYNPATVYKDDTTYALLQYIWSKKDTLTLNDIYVSVPFRNLLAKFPTWETLLKSSVNNMLADSKSNLEEHTYNVLNDTIGYLVNDEYSYFTIYGYQTIFLYFLLHDRGVIKSEQTVKDKVGLIIACGNFSYAEIPKYFDVIIGVTGTLGDLSTVERKIVEKQFGIRKLAFAPTMYGAPKRKFDEKDDVVVIADMDQWYLRILQQTQSKIRGKRAVIVFFETVKTLEVFERKYKTELDTMKYRILDEKSLHKDNLVRQATASGTITLSTASFTRGTDFVCRDPNTESNGGVHVIMTYPTDTSADEVQARGRTGRQGDSGSYELVLYMKDLEKFEIKPADVAANTASGLYSFIKQQRDVQHAKRVKDLIEKAQKMLKNHNLSNEFRDAVVKGTDKNTIISYLLEINHAISQVAVSIPYHIVFALDESGSMKGRRWADLKKAVAQFISKRLEYYAIAGVQCADQVTVVCYSDNARITVPTTTLSNQVAAKIAKLKGGGTNFSAGLLKANEVISKIDAKRYTPALLFMSDGDGVGGESELQLIHRDCQTCQTFIIGFGDGCDPKKLQTMASISGGKYMHGADGLQLVSKFEEICTELSSATYAL